MLPFYLLFLGAATAALTLPLYTAGKEFKFSKDGYSYIATGKFGNFKAAFYITFLLTYITNAIYWYKLVSAGVFIINTLAVLGLVLIFLAGLAHIFITVKTSFILHVLAVAAYLGLVPLTIMYIGIQNSVITLVSYIIAAIMILLMAISTLIARSPAYVVIASTLLLILYEGYLIFV